jgi:hypothetical protein
LHVESLKVASLSVRSAAPALLRTVAVPVRRSWFIPDCSYENTALFSTFTTETAGWLAIWVFIYHITWSLVPEDSNYREKYLLVVTLCLRHIVAYHMHKVPCSESPYK